MSIELIGHARVAADAAARGVVVEIFQRPAAHSLSEAAELLGITPWDIVKTLVLKRSDGTFLFALVPGGRSISWPKLRSVVGVNKLQMPPAEWPWAPESTATASSWTLTRSLWRSKQPWRIFPHPNKAADTKNPRTKRCGGSL